jgi:hypothetical protein
MNMRNRHEIEAMQPNNVRKLFNPLYPLIGDNVNYRNIRGKKGHSPSVRRMKDLIIAMLPNVQLIERTKQSLKKPKHRVSSMRPNIRPQQKTNMNVPRTI